MPWEQVGVYALMSQLATTPTILLTSLINQFYLPVIFHQDPKGEGEFGPSFRRYLLVSAMGTAILAVSVLIAGPYLVRLVSTRDFLGHEHLLALLVVSAALFGMGQQLVLPGLRARRSFIYILPKVIHSAALLVAALLLVPAWGLGGMATASVIAATFYAASVLVANARSGVRI
jgi:O-antigen/teichoic acid export membrane protein